MATLKQITYWESLKGKMPVNLASNHARLRDNPWNKGRKFPQNSGENHFAWKGNLVSYRSLHKWVERMLGKATHCSSNPLHFSTRYHWANISGEYKRELSDWRQLCPNCNMQESWDKRRVLQ